MKTWTIAVLLTACAFSARGQEIPEFSAWMKAKDAAVKEVRSLGRPSGPEAVKNAETLAAVYENMIGFWRQRNAADAVQWSEEGKAAAVAMASAAHTGNTEAAAAAFRKLESGCKSCHTAYRVRLPNGRYAVRMDSGERSGRKR